MSVSTVLYGYLLIGLAWSLVDFWGASSNRGKKGAIAELNAASPFSAKANRRIYLFTMVFAFCFNVVAWPYMAVRYLKEH